MRHRNIGSIGAACAIIVLLLSPIHLPIVSAISSKPTVAPVIPATLSLNGFRISPVRSDLTIPAGTSQTVQVSVLNLTPGSGIAQAEIDDFTAGNNENGVPDILLNGQSAPSHSLRSFVEPIKPFTIGASASVEVNVTIKIPVGTPAGGYYGAIRILPYNPVTPGKGKNVALSGSVASLFLVTVPGQIHEQLSIASFDVRKLITKPYTFSGPGWLFENNKKLFAVVRFDNNGDLQEQPFGKIILEKGKTVINSTQINASVPLGSVLPGSIRQFYEPLTGLGSFGKYTILGNFGYGSDGQLLSDNYSFYVVPLILFEIAGAVIFVLLFLIFILPRLLRAYNRRVLRRSRRRW
jgi:hypothetical protein